MSILRTSLLLGATLAISFAQTASDRFYQAVRNNDLPALRALAGDPEAINARDSLGQTPLTYAAAYGSLDAMNLLIANGAEVNAESNPGLRALHLAVGDPRKVRLLLDHGAEPDTASRIGRTPLQIAAGTYGSLETVKLLLQHGANVNLADNGGFTPLITAATVENTAVVKLLIERGAKIDAMTANGQTGNPLMAAAHTRNLELVRLLLARHPDLSVVSPDFEAIVKNGRVAVGTLSALHRAVTGGNPAVVKLILDAGAPVNGRDVRGMTPLTFAVATDHPNLEIIKLLLAKGADPSIKSKDGESPLDWARKYKNPTVLSAMKLDVTTSAPAGVAKPVTSLQPVSPQAAVERSLPLLQHASAGVFTDGGCVACHAQPMAGMAVALAKARGWRIEDAVRKSSEQESQRIVNNLAANAQVLLQQREGGGTPDTQLYEAQMLAEVHAPADRGTDALVHFLAAKQRPAGHWGGFGSRPPIQDGDITHTAFAIRTLATYAMPSRKAEMAGRVARAAEWLSKQVPVSTEDRVMQILGLKWASAQPALRQVRIQDLLALQRPDGGWAQTSYLESDAYATGQVLYALHEAGASHDPAVLRGTDFLIRTQNEDGSWYVASRAMKIQPYFQSGFPYDHDQWISASGTAWAAVALSLTPPERSAVASAKPTR